ncbi:uncharacterized protein LOC144153600 [Haemaphysalis longicornis]
MKPRAPDAFALSAILILLALQAEACRKYFPIGLKRDMEAKALFGSIVEACKEELLAVAFRLPQRDVADLSQHLTIFCQIYNACKPIEPEPTTSQVIDCIVNDFLNDTGTFFSSDYGQKLSPAIKIADKKVVLCLQRLNIWSVPIQRTDDAIALVIHVTHTYG